YTPTPGCSSPAYACQTYGDECAADSDCPIPPCAPGSYCPSYQCSLNQAGSHVCRPIECVEGRPFLVEGQARTAKIRAREDWRASRTPPLSMQGLSHDQRERLARAWSEIALMEHASIAAFARFVLQLTSLGAPPELVEASNAALADETRHAR